jgi:hypothetical protein
VARRIALAVAFLAGCAPAARAPCRDGSTAFDAKSVPLTVSVDGLTYDLHGPSLSMPPAENGRQRIEVAGGGPAASRMVAFAMPSGDPLPFQIGDVLDVKVRLVAVTVFAGDRAIEVREAGGRLLAMEFEGAAAPEGWSAGERSSGTECFVVVRHGDLCAFVPSNAWRRFETPDGSWAVHATCPEGGRAGPEHTPGPVVVQVTRLPRHVGAPTR